MDTKTSLVFSIIAIEAAVLLFAACPLVATHQAFAYGGYGGYPSYGGYGDYPSYGGYGDYPSYGGYGGYGGYGDYPSYGGYCSYADYKSNVITYGDCFDY